MIPLKLIALSLPHELSLADLQQHLADVLTPKCVRFVDSSIVEKRTDGSIATSSAQIDTAILESPGLLAHILGFHEDGGPVPMNQQTVSLSEGLLGDFGLNPKDIDQMLEQLPYGSRSLFVLVEDLWVRDFQKSVRSTGAITLAMGLVSDRVLDRREPV